MNGNRASGLRKGYSGPSLHGNNDPDQKDFVLKGDFRQASHTIPKIMSLVNVDMVEAVLQALLSKRYSNNFGVCHVQGYHIVP